MTIKIIVNGAKGKMGRIAVAAVNSKPEFNLVAETGRNDDLAQVIKSHQANIVIDFTVPDSAFNNANQIINAGARPVIGTTGLTAEQITQLTSQCAEKKLGGIIVPNFSLGAVLMMRYAQDAAKYLPEVEIIEMHHPQKLDAPSGTAIKTAQMMSALRNVKKATPRACLKSSGVSQNSTIFEHRSVVDMPVNEQRSAENRGIMATPEDFKQARRAAPSRGETHHGIQIHSVRLPGFYSHQTVIFGDAGEVLTICHQGIDRQCCIPGIVLACQQVMSLDHLVYGLENIL